MLQLALHHATDDAQPMQRATDDADALQHATDEARTKRTISDVYVKESLIYTFILLWKLFTKRFNDYIPTKKLFFHRII